MKKPQPTPNMDELLFREVKHTQSPIKYIQDWDPQKLLEQARRFKGQILIEELEDFPIELKPFVDWIVKDYSLLKKEIQNRVEISKYDQIKDFSLFEKKALFLDRDGVINIDHGYVGDPLNIQLVPGIAQLIQRANRNHHELIVVTNQSGIGRGLYSFENFQKVMAHIQDLLRQDFAKIDHIEFAPFHPDSLIPEYQLGRHLRKPRPGMLVSAAVELKVNLRKSILIGDRCSDLIAGVLAGVGNVFLIQSEQSEEEYNQFQEWVKILKYDFKLKNLLENIKVQVIANFNEVSL